MERLSSEEMENILKDRFLKIYYSCRDEKLYIDIAHYYLSQFNVFYEIVYKVLLSVIKSGDFDVESVEILFEIYKKMLESSKDDKKAFHKYLELSEAIIDLLFRFYNNNFGIFVLKIKELERIGLGTDVCEELLLNYTITHYKNKIKSDAFQKEANKIQDFTKKIKEFECYNKEFRSKLKKANDGESVERDTLERLVDLQKSLLDKIRNDIFSFLNG